MSEEPIAKLIATAKSPFSWLLSPFLFAYPSGKLIGMARIGKPILAKSAKIIDFSVAGSFAIASEIWFILLALFGGLILGAAFFGSLSWATKRLNRFRRPVLTMLSLFFLRVAVAVLCFVWLIRTAPLPFAGIVFIGFLFMQILFLIKRKKASRGKLDQNLA